MFTRLYKSREIKKALECYDNVKSYRKASLITGISKSTIHRWYNSFHSLVVRQPIQKKKKLRRSRKPKYPSIDSVIKDLFTDNKLQYFSLKAIRDHLSFDKLPSLSWVRSALKSSRISRRRFQTSRVCTNKVTSLTERYVAFNESLQRFGNEDIICIDETGFSNVGNIAYGYFAKGKNPEHVTVPKRVRNSVVMAINSQGMISYQLQEKPYNSRTYCDFVKSLLSIVPSNAKVLLMDNVSFHKTKELKELVTSILFIPPYSPRCNPIEEVFSLIKRKYRCLDPSTPLKQNIEESIDLLQSVRTFEPYYKHTRYHVENYIKTYCS